MSVKGARVRTESMAQRLSKQPMSEGYTLMDKGYNLGAMRLLTFKAENAPPFQLAPCLEAIATIFLRMDEGADAQENFGYAADKYAMIGQGVLAEVMKIRGIEATAGTEAALALADELIAKADPEGTVVGAPDSKQKANVARAYHLRADLRMQMGLIEEAIGDAQMAGAIGWDRVFEAHYVLGLLHLHKDDLSQAEAALSQCVQLNPNFFAGFEALVDVLMRGGDAKRAQLLQILDKAIELHPRAELIRKKAFTMSDIGQDAAALEMLDKYIANPPHEEAEALFTQQGVAVSTFQKAKAAIYADQKNYAAAKAAAEAALSASKDDQEAQALLKDISEVAKANDAPTA